ncbi:MAG: cupredoxin domain-containing protein [Acidimicrobiia bacterium]
MEGARRKRHRLVTAVAGMVAIVGLGACGGGGDNGGGAGRIGELTATDMLRFDPDEFEVPFEQEVSFTFTNEDNERHNFTLSHVFVDLDNFVNVDVEPDSSTEVRFTVRERPRDGFLTFYCRYHQSQGMSGRITLR